MLDGGNFLVSNGTYTAGTNSAAAKDFLTTPGAPRRGYSYMAELGTVANTGASAGTITINFREGSDTGFTNTTNSNVVSQRTYIIGATATTSPEALNVGVNMTQEYLRSEVIVPAAPAGLSLTGVYVALQAGRGAV